MNNSGYNRTRLEQLVRTSHMVCWHDHRYTKLPMLADNILIGIIFININ